MFSLYSQLASARILLNTVVHNDYPGGRDVWLMSLLASIEGLELKRTG